MKGIADVGEKSHRPGTARARGRAPALGILVIGFVLLLIAGCGGAPSASTGGGEAASPDGTAQAALPGTEEFGLTMEQLVANVEAVEGNIAACMSEAGFEYIAVDFDTVRRGMTADKSLPGMSEEDFIAQYGYGISTLYTGLAPQQAGDETPAKLGLGEQNVQIFNSLSPADQVAYSRALFGEHSDATFVVALEAEDFSRTGGCTRTAIEQVFKPEELTVTYANPLDSLIEQDPRMITAFGEYASCIREAGFDYSHPEQIEADLKERLDAITGGQPPEALSADAMTALTDLQGEERAIAEVAVACEEDILTPVEEQVQRELYARPVQ